MQKGQKIEDKRAGSWGVLGTQMEMHNSLVASFLLLFYFASFLYSLKPYFFSLFFKVSVLRLHWPMFSLISLKVLVLRLALSHVSSNL
jgi:hypothetical protein